MGAAVEETPGHRLCRGIDVARDQLTVLRVFDSDIGESKNVAAEHPDVVKKLLTFAEEARAELGDGESTGKGQRPAGWVDTPSPRLLKKK